ncbi:phosphate ABC transporter permease subunit PstC [Williamwhitmania taraxaci]|uniref:Phosphate transport system permease protein n=1 Tax=Williamwhitmania taraxaci TaxID=1640674 RepID=A0A1G6IKE8_9BACT|nr:phosphate ABC transporter permease subunit PstC [Williamwhitmania taraxaci]SDC06893.1 phosphate ABC transporter membrane protein 1, PhoT family [Williamwhitmania taraxaci]
MTKSFRKNLFEKIIEGILALSGSITSLTVLLIVVFLFKEGFGLFSQSPIESSYVLVVNKSNPITKIDSKHVMQIFDQEITNWESMSGKKDSIILLRMEDVSTYYSDEQIGENLENLPACVSNLTDSLTGVIAFVPKTYIKAGFKGKVIEPVNISGKEFFLGKEWYPTAEPAAQFGILALLLGTLWVSLGAILLSLPLGLAVAIYMAEIADSKVRNTFKPLIELLAGIPSVIYGFFGLVVIVPLIQKVFNLPVGETALAGSIILAIMALPTIITIAEDSLRTTPRAMKEASLALGASRWQTIYRIVIPYSISGITAAAILGIGRAIGETMAVLMVTGNAAVIPHTFLEPVRTIPATIAAELGESSQGGLHYQALFILGSILFIITLIINLTVEYVSSRNKLAKR